MIGPRPQARRSPAARRSWDDMIALLLEITSTPRFRQSAVIGTQPAGRYQPTPTDRAVGTMCRRVALLETRPWGLTDFSRGLRIGQVRVSRNFRYMAPYSMPDACTLAPGRPNALPEGPGACMIRSGRRGAVDSPAAAFTGFAATGSRG